MIEHGQAYIFIGVVLLLANNRKQGLPRPLQIV